MMKPSDSFSKSSSIPDEFQQFEQGTDLAPLRACLLDVCKQPWYTSVFCQTSPGMVPRDYAYRDILQQFGIINSQGTANYRINVINDKPFITDGLWRQDALFAYTDESLAILQYIETHQVGVDAEAIVDPACGCGHTPIAFERNVQRYGFDVNPRAVRFTQLNAKLNNRQITAVQNDIADGFPNVVTGDRRYLFAANMPFAISPYAGALSIVRDGGENGIKWSVAVLETLKPFVGNGSTAVILSYSLGNSGTGIWQLYEKAKQLLAGCKLSWELTKEKIWRVGLEKTEPNPMRLRESLPKKADGLLTEIEEERENMRQAYITLASELEKSGWDILGCGILEVQL